MTGMGRSWRRLQRELTPGAPSVGAVNGWRRYAKPAGLVTVAALVGAGIVLALGGGGGTPKPVVHQSFVASDSRVISVLATSHGCRTSSPRYPSGKLLVQVTNRNATGLGTVALLENGLPVSEREEIPPGSTASFAASLQPGRYVLQCAGVHPPNTTLTITGPKVAGAAPDTSKLLLSAAQRYSSYVDAQSTQVVSYLRQLVGYVRQNRIVRAQCAYGHARQHLDYFVELAGIDVLGGERLEDGWNTIAKGLYDHGRITGLVSPAQALLDTARRLQAGTPKLPIQSANIADAASELLQNVFKSETFGEAEPYSHGDLLDITSLVQGSHAAFSTLRPALTNVDPDFVTGIEQSYNNFFAVLRKLRAPHSETGYVGYNTLNSNTKKEIAHAVTALEDKVSDIPMKLVHQ